jgi:hypothetical protein
MADANFKGVITTPAWRSKPSWMLVPTKDRTSTLTSNGGMLHEPVAARSKFQAPLGLLFQA